jgi:hypothetical protein
VSDAGVTLHNNGTLLADLSEWELRVGKKEFTLPDDTVLPAGKSVLLSSRVTGLASSTEAELDFPSGELAYAFSEHDAAVLNEASSTAQLAQAARPASPVARAPAPAPVAYILDETTLPNATTSSPAHTTGSFFNSLVASVAAFVVR